MDIVITYVDGLDRQWQSQYAEYVGGEALDKRFRDWGTLKYLLRGVQECMPFVENVFLVVALDSQVPSWVDRNNVKVVLHKDIIPERFLPVFNSTAIEMYLPCIEGLSEEFIYFNDDSFPVANCRREDFFVDGKAVGKPSKEFLALNMYKKQSKNASDLARKAAGLRPSLSFLRPQHCPSAMLLSACREVLQKVPSEIEASISRVREPKNINQYIFTDYATLTGRMIPRRLQCKHFSLAVASLKDMEECILGAGSKLVCINDVHLSEEKYGQYRAGLLAAFDRRFPRKSRFEL